MPNTIGVKIVTATTSGDALDIQVSGGALNGINLSNSSNAGNGIISTTTGIGSQAGYFYNGNQSPTISALHVQNDGAGTYLGLAADFAGSVVMYGFPSSNNLTYNAPTNSLELLNGVTGSNINFTTDNININGSTAINSFVDIVNSSNYQIAVGFASGTVPAIAGGTVSSPIVFPLPSNTPTLNYVLTGQGAGVAPIWAASSSGACPTCLLTSGGQTITGSDIFSASQTFNGAVALNGGVTSNVTPGTNNTYDLGSSGDYWRFIYGNSLVAYTNLTVETGSIYMNTSTQVIDPTGQWVGPHVGTVANPVSQMYATTIGDTSHYVSNIYATNVGTTSNYVTNGAFSHIWDQDLISSSASCVGATAGGELFYNNFNCGNANYPSTWSTWSASPSFNGNVGTLDTARYIAFGKNVTFTLSVHGTAGTYGGINDVSLLAPTSISSAAAYGYNISVVCYNNTSGVLLPCYGIAAPTVGISINAYPHFTSGATYYVEISGTYETP